MPPKKRERGYVRRRGNSHQVFVYAGVDPVTGKEIYLTESTTDDKQVEPIRTRLLAQVDRQRNASTKATLGYVIETWLDQHDGDETTLDSYRGYHRRTIGPRLGDEPVSRISTRMLEKFYAQLRKCSALCDGNPTIDHRTTRSHECRVVKHKRKPGRPSQTAAAEHDCSAAGCSVIECKPHTCKPMARSSIRQIHSIISGALDMALRWEWIDANPAAVAKKPKQQAPNPKPPTPQQAAELVEAAFEEDFAWGMLVWLKMLTGPRRGEVLALQFDDVDFDEKTTDPDQREGVLQVTDNYVVRNGKKTLKDTKDHQKRRVALDSYTLAGVAQLWDEYVARTVQLDVKPTREAFLFSYAADNSRPCNPDGITHRFGRMCKRLGIDCHLHSLRHYSATELITAGVDVRTVAGRLGHGGGGTTTLRVYSAWVPESDKRAASLLAGRMPRPGKRNTD
jgi:integrase